MTEKEKISIVYHSLFKYTLSKDDLIRWQPGLKLKASSKLKVKRVKFKTFERENKKKMAIAKRAALILNRIPTVMFAGITGSLAMSNAKPESDIDIMIITNANTLWITRAFTLIVLFFAGFALRRANNKDEKNKLCLNFWIDETALAWNGPRNVYTAHEVVQVIPLVNKKLTYEQWLSKNRWVLNYWPKGVNIKQTQSKKLLTENGILKTINKYFFFAQYLYMRSKLTCERVGLHYAFFHPYDWGEKIKHELTKVGIFE